MGLRRQTGSLLIHAGSFPEAHGLFCYASGAPELAGLVVVEHELSCSMACEILVLQPGIPALQGLHCKVDSLPLDHQEDPIFATFCAHTIEALIHIFIFTKMQVCLFYSLFFPLKIYCEYIFIY